MRKIFVQSLVLAVSFIILLGAVEANAACTNITALPYTVSSSGSYCLTVNVNKAFTNSAAITINASNVVLDLGGYSITQTDATSAKAGVYASGRNNVTVKNGRLMNFDHGVDLVNNTGGSGAVVENLFVDMSGRPVGIYVSGNDGIVRNCQVRGNGSGTQGINLEQGFGGAVVNNDVFNSGGQAIYMMQHNVVVENNRVAGGSQDPAGTTGIEIAGGRQNELIMNNRITKMELGIHATAGTSGKFSGIVTSGCTTPFAIDSPDFIDAGNNN